MMHVPTITLDSESDSDSNKIGDHHITSFAIYLTAAAAAAIANETPFHPPFKSWL